MLSLKEIKKINKHKKIIKIIKRVANDPKRILRKYITKIAIADLKKTWYLNTAIIENEWSNKFKKDIFDGPKYLKPLIDSISL